MSAREKSADVQPLTEVLERLAAIESKFAGITRNGRAGEPIPLACYSIRQFCAAHDISEDMFFKIQRQGFAPKTMRVGARTLISIEAAAEWRHERESHDPAPVMQSHPRGKIVAAENRRSVASPVKRRAALSHPNPAHEPVREITARARGRRRALATE